MQTCSWATMREGSQIQIQIITQIQKEIWTNTNLCMSNDERAVPNTRARAELTATACKLPRPSLMMKKGWKTWLCLTSLNSILLFKKADGKECDAVDPCQWVHRKQNLSSEMIKLYLHNQNLTMRMKNGFLFSLLRSLTIACRWNTHVCYGTIEGESGGCNG